MLTSAPPAYWDDVYANRKLEYSDQSIPFQDLFAQYLPRSGTCFEIGCYPGQFLIYLGKTFGYSVSGVDTTPGVDTVLPSHIASHGVAVDDLIRSDFFKFSTRKKYDVVCSFGFIEHFKDYHEVIRRQCDLVADNGYAVITCPNFCGFQWLFHRWLDPLNLSRHVIAAMNLRAWQKTLRDSGFDILHAGYYQTFGFWHEDPICTRLKRLGKRAILRIGNAIERRVSFPHWLLSPYMICIAKKVDAP